MEVGVLVFCLGFHEIKLNLDYNLLKSVTKKKLTEKNTEYVHTNVFYINVIILYLVFCYLLYLVFCSLHLYCTVKFC
jgi:hypothetical protein